MKLIATNRPTIENQLMEGPFALISIRDPLTGPVAVKDTQNLRARLDLEFNDIDEEMPGTGLVAPTLLNAQYIRDFIKHNQALGKELFIAQCEAGVGRSQAIAAWFCENKNEFLRKGTHNRLLYRLLCEAEGIEVKPEPLVSMAVRIKYPTDRIAAFLLSMKRQRHRNWEVVAVTDGHPDYFRRFANKRVRIVETKERKGNWGHPYRQLALDACEGDFIGMSNDDNYYCPGYIDQMLFAMEEQNADVVLCSHLHSYAGWAVVDTKLEEGHAELGSWIARAELVRQVRWEGNEILSDWHYIERLAKVARKVGFVRKPLFVHN